MQDLGTRYEEVVSLTDTIVNRLNRFIANIKPLNVQVQDKSSRLFGYADETSGQSGQAGIASDQLALQGI